MENAKIMAEEDLGGGFPGIPPSLLAGSYIHDSSGLSSRATRRNSEEETKKGEAISKEYRREYEGSCLNN